MVKDSSTIMLRNKSFTYILPLIGGRGKYFNNLSGCFLGDLDHPEKKDKIFLLYRMNKKWSDELHEWLLDILLFDHYYDVNDEYRMYVFNLPDGYEKNYYMFQQGKYSQFDDEYKKYLLGFHKDSLGSDVAFMDKTKKVLYRSEELYQEWEEKLSCPELNSFVVIPRDQEISSVPDKALEYFTCEMIKQSDNSKPLKEWD